MAYTDHGAWHNAAPFNLSFREVAIATAAALTVYFTLFGVGISSDASDVMSAGTKMDRMPLAGEPACAGQAWGAWSQDCLNALTQKENLQLAPSRTVEFRDGERQLSILVREPAKS